MNTGRSTLRTRTVPLTDQQREVWIASRLGGAATGAYLCPIALELRGPLRVTALVGAVDDLVERHESLRTCFPDGDAAHIWDGLLVNVPLLDLSPYSGARQETMVRQWYDAELRAGLDPGQAPLVRFHLLRLDAERHHLVVTHHHIVADGWAGDVLLRELGALYRARCEGTSSSLPPAPRLADHGEQCAALQESPAFAAARAYWTGKFADGFPDVRLPADATASGAGDQAARRIRVPLPAPLVRELRRVSAHHSATLYMTLLAAFRVFVHRISGADDLVVGASFLNRPSAQDRDLVAHRANVLCLREPVYDPRRRFDAVLDQVRAEVLTAHEHGVYPLQRLVEEVGFARDSRRSAPVTAVFNMEREDVTADFGPAVEVSPVPMDTLPGSPFEVTLTAVQTGTDISLDLVFRPCLHSEGTARRWLEQYRTLLEGVARDPAGPVGRLPMMPAEERRTVVETWNRTERDLPAEQCLHRLVGGHAARTPGAAAVVSPAGTLTYGELDTAANRLAHHLLAQGVTVDRPVAVCLPRTPELIVALLAVLKAGGAYLPLDANYPAARLTHMLDDSGAAVVITRHGMLPETVTATRRVVELDRQRTAIDSLPSHAPRTVVAPDNLAYVLYTSGSTGVPKGTMTSHRNVTRLVFGLDHLGLGPGRRILAAAPISFDASTFEIWGALAHGGTCVLHPDGVPEAHALFAVMREHRVDTAWLTAALFNAVLDSGPEQWPPLRHLVVGGEALSAGHVRRALARLPGTSITNGYGPTESTTFACCHEIPADLPAEVHSVPIGRPIGNTQAYVLGPGLEPVPVGVEGELFLAGPGLARGYLGRPATTARHFLPNPYGPPGSRLYRTGDLARWNPDGTLQYLGRTDHQLKIRGHRIEPGEIEATLRRHPAIHNAVVVPYRTSAGDQELAAHAVLVPGRTCSAEEAKEFLAGVLPRYLLPARILFLDALPLTANGKVDRRALPDPADHSPAPPAEDTPAGAGASPAGPSGPTPTEERLTAIWAEVLKKDGIGLDDDFFELGGHSLRATQIISRIRRSFSAALPLTAFFDHPSIRAQAKIIDSLVQEVSGD
ncbi:amino acid adenylation domain-containing protein [Streptomyces sp. NPDC001851]|uniref:non-ribosomal peptide synthetase n=1 Tax=Streptomyces sp. NPDC001851 TaxID=3154529 RepID=UPI00332A9F4B